MTKRKTKRKTKMSRLRKPIADISRMIGEHPEVQLILEIAMRAKELSVTEIPVDFETVPTRTTTTASSSTGQHLFVVV